MSTSLTTETPTETSKEEDLLERSKRRSKNGVGEEKSQKSGLEGATTNGSKRRRSYRDSVLGVGRKIGIFGEEDLDGGEVSDDDLIEESTDGTWFAIGMTRKEIIESRRLWRNSLFVKLVGKMISYHYL